MNQYVAERAISLAISIVGGMITYILVKNLMLTLLVFLAVLLAALVVLARGFPIAVILYRPFKKHLGLLRSFPNQSSAELAMVTAGKKSSQLDIMLIRGHHLILDENSLLNKLLKARGVKANTRILLLDPDSDAIKTYLTKKGLDDHEHKMFLSKCHLVQEKLDRYKQQELLDYRYFDNDPIWKLIITDTKVFCAGYDPSKEGPELPIAEYKDFDFSVYIALSIYFESIWAKS